MGLSVSVLATGAKRCVTRSVKNESAADQHVHHAGGERTGVLEFRDRSRLAKVEAGRGVDEHAGAQAGFVLETPDHVAVRLGENLPVDEIGRVALDVIAVLGELDRRAEIG